MFRKIFLIIVCVMFAGSSVALAFMRHPVQAPDVDFSTYDEATPDEATKDEATRLEVQPCTDIPTEKAAENATESPTEACTESPTEAVEPTQVEEKDSEESAQEYEDDDYEPEVEQYEYEDDGYQDEYVPELKIPERDLIARMVCLETGGCSEYCQWLVASTALNIADRSYGGNVEAVITNPSIFSVANYLYSREPDSLNYHIADRVLSGDRDYQVMAFRTDYYHSFGTPYTVVDNVYFSTY